MTATLDEFKFPTRVRNALRRQGIVFPQNMTIIELLRVPGIGPESIKVMAEILEKHCV